MVYGRDKEKNKILKIFKCSRNFMCRPPPYLNFTLLTHHSWIQEWRVSRVNIVSSGVADGSTNPAGQDKKILLVIKIIFMNLFRPRHYKFATVA